MHVPTREEAWHLLQKYIESPALRNHGIAVEATMKHFSANYQEDKEKWGIIGLVHDLDWEAYPDQHCHKTAEILLALSWPPEYIRAIQSHGWGICTEVEPQSTMEKVLYATDELTGLIYAAALLRPSRSLDDLSVSSVMKKWKSKSFAAGVDRTVIDKGTQMLDISRGELIEETILAMRSIGVELGLQRVE